MVTVILERGHQEGPGRQTILKYCRGSRGQTGGEVEEKITGYRVSKGTIYTIPTNYLTRYRVSEDTIHTIPTNVSRWQAAPPPRSGLETGELVNCPNPTNSQIPTYLPFFFPSYWRAWSICWRDAEMWEINHWGQLGELWTPPKCPYGVWSGRTTETLQVQWAWEPGQGEVAAFQEREVKSSVTAAALGHSPTHNIYLSDGSLEGLKNKS